MNFVACFALCLLAGPQEDPQESASDRYFTALHRMEVQAEYVSAAFAMLQLGQSSESQEDLNLRAKAFAQAYRAFLAAGRPDDAQKAMLLLQPLMQRAGVEKEVAPILQLAESLKAPQRSLDPDFLEVVRQALAKRRRESLVPYGRQVLPYLSEVMDSDYWKVLSSIEKGEFQNPSPEVIRFMGALRLGLALGGIDFADEFLALSRTWPGSSLNPILVDLLSPKPNGDSLWSGLERISLHLSEADSIERAQAGAEFGIRLLNQKELPGLIQVLGRRFQKQEDPLAVSILAAMNSYSSPVLRESKLPDLASLSANPRLADRARYLALRWGDSFLLARRLEGGGDFDQIRFLLSIVGKASVRRTNLPVVDEAIGLLGAGYPGEHREGEPKAVFEIGREQVELEPEQHLLLPYAWLTAMLQDDHPTVRRLAAVAASRTECIPGMLAAMASQDDAVKREILRELKLKRKLESELAQGVRALIQQERFASEASALLFSSFDPRNFDELKLWHSVQPGGALETWLARGTRFQGTSEGQKILLALALDTNFDPEIRSRALQNLQTPWPLQAGQAWDVLDGKLNPNLTSKLARQFFYSWLQHIHNYGPLSSQEIEQIAPWVVEVLYLGYPERAIQHNSDAIFRNLALMDSAFSAALLQKSFLKNSDFGKWIVDQVYGWPTVSWSVLPKFLSREELLDLADHLMPRNGVFSKQAKELVMESGRPELVLEGVSWLDLSPEELIDYQEPIRALLRSSDYALLAATALAEKSGGEYFVPNMIEAWNRFQNLSYPEHLITALGQTLDPRTVPVLLQALGSKNEEVAQAAEKALDRMRKIEEERLRWETWQLTGSTVSPAAALLPKLNSENLEVRIAAIDSLGTLQAKEALPLLVDLLEDPEPKVVEAARRALAKINGNASTTGN
ncbi:MAG: HEAT repeat domain-containing protein [Planctomycetota bacterium]|nr:MAG: HEAT repeat domain-containing protein [Planctomycetota bacterium]